MLSPKAAPTMADSQSGVLRTLSALNLSTNPSVTLNTPPYAPISCPMHIIDGFFSMLMPRPSWMASIIRISRPLVVGAIGEGVPGANRSSNSSSTFATIAGRSVEILSPSNIACLCLLRISVSSASVRPPFAFKCAVSLSTGSIFPHFSISPSG